MLFNRENLHRFNAPGGEFGTLYFSTDLPGAFAETFLWMTGNAVISQAALKQKLLIRCRPRKALALADLRGKGLAAIGADNRLCAGDDYALSQQWALAIWNNGTRPDGILYRARHDPSRHSIALFDRAKAKVEVIDASPVSRAVILPTLQLYNVTVIPD